MPFCFTVGYQERALSVGGFHVAIMLDSRKRSTRYARQHFAKCRFACTRLAYKVTQSNFTDVPQEDTNHSLLANVDWTIATGNLGAVAWDLYATGTVNLVWNASNGASDEYEFLTAGGSVGVRTGMTRTPGATSNGLSSSCMQGTVAGARWAREQAPGDNA